LLLQCLESSSPRASENFQDKLKPVPTAAETWYQIRGEAFNSHKLEEAAIWDSGTVPARWREANLGFRCVRDVK
jgi:hypothetical protein